MISSDLLYEFPPIHSARETTYKLTNIPSGAFLDHRHIISPFSTLKSHPISDPKGTMDYQMEYALRISPRYWQPDEHQRYLQGLRKCGYRDAVGMSKIVKTRGSCQTRNHQQKYFEKVIRETRRHVEVYRRQDELGPFVRINTSRCHRAVNDKRYVPAGWGMIVFGTIADDLKHVEDEWGSHWSSALGAAMAQVVLNPKYRFCFYYFEFWSKVQWIEQIGNTMVQRNKFNQTVVIRGGCIHRYWEQSSSNVFYGTFGAYIFHYKKWLNTGMTIPHWRSIPILRYVVCEGNEETVNRDQQSVTVQL